METNDLLVLYARWKNTPDCFEQMGTEYLLTLWAFCEKNLKPGGFQRPLLVASGAINPEDDEQIAELRDAIKTEVFRRDKKHGVQSPIIQAEASFSKIVLDDARGRKTNFFRVVDALYDLGYFYGDGTKLTRKEVFNAFGRLFSDNFEDFESYLSQAYRNTSAEANTRIFDEMKAAIEKKTTGEY